jgi:hypothetical protein
MRFRRTALALSGAAALIALGGVPALASGSAGPNPGTVGTGQATGIAAGVGAPGTAPLTHGITEQCGNGGSGYCLNDQNNGGEASSVQMWYGGVSNDAFTVVPLSLMCHDGHVHANAPYGPCPFTSGSGLNSQLNGATIFSIGYQNGLCVGTTSSTLFTLMTGCPDALGNNGGWGTIQISALGPACNASYKYYAENRYWSDAYGAQSSLQTGGNPGVQASIAHNNGTATCWGQVLS